MTEHASHLPFSIEALVAEAKRRARQRRLLVAGVLVLIVAGVIGGLFGSRFLGAPGAGNSGAAGGVSLVLAKGPAFPMRTFVLILRHDHGLTVGDVKVTENGGSVLDPTLSPAIEASGDGVSSKEYLLQYKSLAESDKTIRVQVSVKDAGTAVSFYLSPASAS
jgi:hypothetical protein